MWVVLPTEYAVTAAASVAELITEFLAEVGPHHPATEYVPTSTAPSEERREA